MTVSLSWYLTLLLRYYNNSFSVQSQHMFQDALHVSLESTGFPVRAPVDITHFQARHAAYLNQTFRNLKFLSKQKGYER